MKKNIMIVYTLYNVCKALDIVPKNCDWLHLLLYIVLLDDSPHFLKAFPLIIQSVHCALQPTVFDC